MKNSLILNNNNLKFKVMKDIFIFLSQSKSFTAIEFKKFNKISLDDKLKCLNLSKHISMCIKKNKITDITDIYILKMVSLYFKNHDFNLYKKNIELIKFYTILFTEKSCSHLTFYLFNNIDFSTIYKNKNCLSIVIKQTKKYTIILNENLNIFSKTYFKKVIGEPFVYKDKTYKYINLKYKLFFVISVLMMFYTSVYSIPSNHVIIEMNLTMHMKINHGGRVISYKSSNKSAKNMIKYAKNLNSKINNTIYSFINYGLENNILIPGEKVKIYIIGPPLDNNFFENLENSLKDIPINIIINNSGNLVKINST